MDTVQLLGSAMGLGFVAGVRLYSAVLVLGLGLRFGWFELPAGFNQHAGVLTNPIVLTVAAIGFLAEFLADKVPWVDSAWDAFHTFVRPLGAAVLAATMIGHIDPSLKFAAVLLCGGVAFTSHSSKAATRLAVNHSPEPFSNIGLSLLEDLLAPVGVWLSLKHPEVVLALVCVFLLVFAWLSPKVFRLLRLQAAAVWSWIAKSPVPSTAESVFDKAKAGPDVARALSVLGRYAAPLPDGHCPAVLKYLKTQERPLGIRSAATKKVRGLRNSIGYLTISDEELLFVARRFFRYRVHRTRFEDIQSAELKRGMLMNRLIIRTRTGDLTFYLFKDSAVV